MARRLPPPGARSPCSGSPAEGGATAQLRQQAQQLMMMAVLLMIVLLMIVLLMIVLLRVLQLWWVTMVSVSIFIAAGATV